MARRPKAEFEITAVDKSRAVIRGVDNSLARLTRTVTLGTRALGGLGLGIGVTEVGRLADRYNQLAVRIRTATKDTGDFESVQAELLATSIATGTALEETVGTFQALSRIREDVGATNDQMITLTKTVQQLGVISGASGDNLRFGLRQLNQGFASVVFRAEEFNGITENIPELAKRIADGFGKTQGELRQMVLDGKLLSRDVINVLLRQAPEIAAEFEEIPSNLDRAFGALQTAIGSAFSQLDQKIGLTESLADAVDRLAANIAVAAGKAGPELQLQEQLSDIQDEIDGVNRQLANFRSQGINLPPERLEVFTERLRELQAQAAGTRDALAFIQSSGGGELAADDAAPGTLSDEALLDSKGRAAKHFQSLLDDEAKYLESQETLRIGGLRHLWQQIAAEEEQLRQDQLARALGFEDAQTQARFEREEELFQARLEANEMRHDEEVAQELGFEDARHRAVEDQEREHQQRLIAARNRFNRIATAQAKFLADFEIAKGKQKTLVLLQEAQSLLQGVSGHSKAAFNIQKGLALAEAVISAQSAAIAAWDQGMRVGGPYVAAAFTALSIARTASMIASIQSTSFQGGASAGSGGAGGGGGGFIQQGEVRDIPVVSSEERNEARIRVEVTGGGDDFSRVVADNLRISVEQGDGTLFSDRSRQAIELRE